MTPSHRRATTATAAHGGLGRRCSALSEDAFAGAFERGGALTPEQARAIVDDVDVRHR